MGQVSEGMGYGIEYKTEHGKKHGTGSDGTEHGRDMDGMKYRM